MRLPEAWVGPLEIFSMSTQSMDSENPANASNSEPRTSLEGFGAEHMPTEVIDLAQCDDPRDAVHRAVACLAQGGVIILPSETCYLLASSALSASAVERLEKIRGGGSTRPLSLAIKSIAEFQDWVPASTGAARKLVERLWPGPVTFLVDVSDRGLNQDQEQGLAGQLPALVRSHVVQKSFLALSSPSYDLIRELLSLLPGPLVLASTAQEGETGALALPDVFLGRQGIDMVLLDGEGTPDEPTLVRLMENAWEVVESGAMSHQELTRAAASVLLFVCTGNTCRSPMAEALCKRRLAETLDCEVADLEARGFFVSSAGVSAMPGAPAATEAMATMREMRASLEGHASQPLSPKLAAGSDWIVAMTQDHLEAILDVHPELNDRVILLDPRGGDVLDPYGQSREVYRKTASLIDQHLKNLLARLDLPS